MPSSNSSDSSVMSEGDADSKPRPIFTTAAGQTHDSAQRTSDLLEIKYELSKLSSLQKQHVARYNSSSHCLVIDGDIIQFVPYSQESLLCESIYTASLSKVWEIEEILERWSETDDYPARVVTDTARRINDKTKHLLGGKLLLTKGKTISLNQKFVQ